LNKGLLATLHPDVEKAFNASKILLQTAKELSHVRQDRQQEILKLMESCNDYSIVFARGLILKTPAAKRAKTTGKKTPWAQAEDKSLSENLVDIEKSEPTLDMRVSTLSPAKEGSLWTQRVALMRTECQMRCGKGSGYFSLYTRQGRSVVGPVRTCVASRTRFSTDCELAVSGKRFLFAWPRGVQLMLISRNG
jgi:hypothetical protein